MIWMVAAVVVAFTMGFWTQWYLLFKRPFPIHLRFPNGQVIGLAIPTEMWRYGNGNMPLQLQVNDDGKPPPMLVLPVVPDAAPQSPTVASAA